MHKSLILLAIVMLFSLGSMAQNIETQMVKNFPDGHFSQTMGRFIIEGEVLDEMKEGNWYEIFAEKHLIHRMIQFHQSKKNGIYLEIDETGALVKKAEYIDDQLNGASYTWYRGGRLSQMNNYKNGLLDGEQIQCYEEGSNREISYYKEGKRDGLTTWYDQSGRVVMSIEYKAGLFEGEQKTYYPNGQLKSSKFYKDNVLHGASTEYYDNGSVKTEATYKKGQLSGKLKTYEQQIKKEGKEAELKLDASKKVKKG